MNNAEYLVGGVKGGNRSAPHTALCRVIVEYLQLRGAWVFRVHGHLGQQAGVSDILACCPPDGRLIACEVKTGKGRMNAGQHRQQAALEAAGGLFILARSVDDVEDALVDAGIVRERLLWPVGSRR